MAASILILLSCLLLVPSSSAQPAAPGPTAASGPPNVTAVLEQGGQYSTLIRLLQATRVDEQLNSQLNNSFNGLTVLAPTDNAFQSLKPGTLNALSLQEQIELVLFHVLPRFFTPALFATASNPVNTQASGADGVDTLNITSSSASGGGQVNISTGVVTTPLGTALRTEFPLAVYSVDKVLLPYSIFGAKPPAAAPAPAKAKPAVTKTPPTASTAEPPSTDAPAGSGSSSMMRSAAGTALLGVGMMAIIVGLFF